VRITTQKTGGIWHGYLEGHPEIDERGLTEEKAREKVQRIVEARGWNLDNATQGSSPDTHLGSKRP
jgi:hypothetical protein